LPIAAPADEKISAPALTLDFLWKFGYSSGKDRGPGMPATTKLKKRR
jgi:hypothetical protein